MDAETLPASSVAPTLLWLGFAIAIATMAMGWTAYNDVTRSDYWSGLLVHSRIVLDELDHARTDTLSAEVAMHYNLRTDNRLNLNKLFSVVSQLKNEIALLRKLTHDNLPQQKRVDKIESITLNFPALLQQHKTPTLTRPGDFTVSEADLVAISVAFDEIGAELAQMSAREDQLVAQRSMMARRASRGITVIAVGSGFSSLWLLLVCCYAALTTKRLKHSTQALIESREQCGSNWMTLQHARKMADQFRAVVESVPDAMMIVNADGKIIFANSQTESLFKYEHDELVGQSIEILVPTRFREQHPLYRAGYFVAPTPRPMGAGLDLAGLRKDGTEFLAEISLSPIKTPDGTLVTAAVRDITKRKQLEEEHHRKIYEANRLKSEFLANMSHELRTPLNAIIGFATLIHNEKVGPVSAEQKEYLGDVLSSSQHLLQLINDILDLAKVESGKMEFHNEPVDLATIVGGARDTLRGLAAEKHVVLESHIDPALSTVTLDPAKLKQVLYNYVSNAIKFTPENGKVTIRIVPETEDMFRIDVEDNGIGIRPDDMERLFIEFHQLDAGAAKRYAGTGLGLSLTKRIVEAQGGKVTVMSTLDRGSIFSAILPRSVPESDAAADAPRAGHTQARTGPVLIIDEDPRSARLIEATLEQLGYRTLCKRSGREALRAVEEDPPCVIVLDLFMPEMSGFEFLDKLRRTPSGGNIPVVVWTAKDLTEQERARLRSLAQTTVLRSEGGTGRLLDEIRPYLVRAERTDEIISISRRV